MTAIRMTWIMVNDEASIVHWIEHDLVLHLSCLNNQGWNWVCCGQVLLMCNEFDESKQSNEIRLMIPACVVSILLMMVDVLISAYY